MRYRAFISYSHSDAHFAHWLHARLETYRLPKALIGRVTDRGEVPARLLPIFRDREELPAATSLTQEVRAALDQSAVLVVICSPAACASQWVNREIELFRELHPDRPILLALKDGDPATAFPPAITAGVQDAEPLAADFLSRGDGRRLGLLKLIAGLTGVPLGDLVQRDAQRKIRRVMAVTVLAAILAILMATMAVIAIQSREDAQNQQAEAEDLVRFMITDLRDKLDDAGRLDLLTVANERALDYYRAQDLDGLDPQSLALRAAVLHAIGEDREKQGDLAGALDAFEEAAATTQAQLATDPDDPELIFADAQSHYWVGFSAMRELRNDKAALAFERYRKLSNQLTRIDPANTEWRTESAYAASNLGTVRMRTKGGARDALALFKESLAGFQTIAQAQPDNDQALVDIADAHAWIADSYLALNRFDEARSARAEQARVVNQLIARDPENAAYPRFLAGHGLGMAMIERDAGNIDLALRLLRENYALAARQAASDPANRELEKRRVSTQLYLAQLESKRSGTMSDARSCSRENQELDPEFVLLCGLLGEQMFVNEETRRFVCRSDDHGASLRLGIDLEEVRDSIEYICKEVHVTSRTHAHSRS